MIDLLSLGIIGVLIGAFTGIVPGIHPNTVIFGSLPLYLSSGVGFMTYASFITGISVSHTFHDFLPSIYMQAPDANTALSTPPGAEKAAKGLGPEAYHSTLLGGIMSIIGIILILPILYTQLESIYAFFNSFMAYVVGFFLLFLIFREESIDAVITSILAGLFGLIALNSSLGGSFILMPIFSGLFAFPALISSLNRDYSIPEQDVSADFKGIRGGFAGLASGLIAGIVPGVGAAASTSFLSPLMDEGEDFLAGMGGVNTTDIIASLLALLIIGKARSGSAVALQSLVKPIPSQIFLLLGLSVFCAGLSALIALRTEKFFIKVLDIVDFRKLAILVLTTILVSSILLSGIFGLLCLITGSFIGGYSMLNDCRGCCMAVLLVPAIIFLI